MDGLAAGTERETAAEFGIGAGPIPFEQEQDARERRVGLAEIRIEFECARNLGSRLAAASVRLLARRNACTV